MVPLYVCSLIQDRTWFGPVSPDHMQVYLARFSPLDVTPDVANFSEFMQYNRNEKPTWTALSSSGVYTGWKRTQSPRTAGGTVLTASGCVSGEVPIDDEPDIVSGDGY